MKIIGVDNAARDDRSDKLVCENVSPNYADKIVEWLNAEYCGEYDGTFFKCVPDDHKLHVFEGY